MGALVLAQVFDTSAALVLPLTGATLLACCALPPVAGSGDSGIGKLDCSLVLFLACYVCAALAGQDPIHSLVFSAPVLPALGIYSALARGACKKTVLFLLAVAGAVVAIRLLLSAATDDREPGEVVTSLGLSWLVVPNDVLVLACLFPSMRGWIADRKGWRIWTSMLGALVFAAAWALESRIAMIASLLVIAIDALVSARIKLLRDTQAMVPLLVAASLMAILASHKSFQSAQARIELWRQASCLFWQHPMVGVGPHNFATARDSCASEALAVIDGRNMPWPHNVYLEIAAETGLVGVTAGMMLLFSCFCIARARMQEFGIREVYVPGSILMVLLISGFVEITLLRLWVWTLASVALGWLRAKPLSRGLNSSL